MHCRGGCSAIAARALCEEATQQQAESAAAPGAVTADEARAYSVWARLEREFALSDECAAAETGGLLLPRHDGQRFQEFLGWMASDGERARLQSQVRVAVGLFTVQTRLTDWSADERFSSALRQHDEAGY